MSIAEIREKCKSCLERVPRDALIVAILVAVSTLSFSLGYLAGRDARPANPIIIDIPATDSGNEAIGPDSRALPQAAGQVVASKNGSKYYLPACAGAERISTANKIWFASAEAAQRAGYSPAANCKGL